MDDSFRTAVEQVIEQITGQPATVVGADTVGGGCISKACSVTLSDRRRFFVKSNANPLPGLFESEANGLNALRNADIIRVPQVLGTRLNHGNVPAFIVMESIATVRPGPSFSEHFGRDLARLHQATQQDRFGFDEDNYLGSTRQPNRWSDNWCAFWRQRRLGYLLQLARQKGVSDTTLDQLGAKLMDRLEDFIDTPKEAACLLHGDLWGGNYLVDQAGKPVLIDPAVYYGRREADLAMTMLFGGFDDRFYSAYQQTWPLAPGYELRLEIYKLYHLLNHLVLFGRSYYGQCVATLRSLISDE